MKLLQINKEKNKISVYLSEETVNTDFDWRVWVSSNIQQYLSNNPKGVCQVTFKVDDKRFLTDLLDFFDTRFPKRIYIRY